MTRTQRRFCRAIKAPTTRLVETDETPEGISLIRYLSNQYAPPTLCEQLSQRDEPTPLRIAERTAGSVLRLTSIPACLAADQQGNAQLSGCAVCCAPSDCEP